MHWELEIRIKRRTYLRYHTWALDCGFGMYFHPKRIHRGLDLCLLESIVGVVGARGGGHYNLWVLDLAVKTRGFGTILS